MLLQFVFRHWGLTGPPHGMGVMGLENLLGVWPLCLIFTRDQFWPVGIAVACVCVCVCQSVCQSLACPSNNSGPVQVRITKFGSKVRNNLVKVPIVCAVIDLDLQGQS